MYATLKILHIFAVTAWMAGMFYLPRLFVYHADAAVGGEASETFKVMEYKLLRFIMTPAMLASWVFGLALIFYVGAGGWLWIKIVCVVLMSGVHGYLARCVKDFAKDANEKAGRHFRIVNEIPTLLFLIILIMVVAKPFA
ncbi:MAG: protoporphyrinogen oxidase HemJ [Pseudomonadota bacterium]